MIPVAQNPHPNFFKNLFILNYTTSLLITGFEQLSSSICCRVIAGQTFPEREKYAFFETFWIFETFWLLTHNFGYRYASRSIKSSIDTDFGLVFKKTLIQKNGSMG